MSAVFVLAAGLGFEPRQTESESVVLPLHYPATDLSARVEPLSREKYTTVSQVMQEHSGCFDLPTGTAPGFQIPVCLTLLARMATLKGDAVRKGGSERDDLGISTFKIFCLQVVRLFQSFDRASCRCEPVSHACLGAKLFISSQGRLNLAWY